MYTPFCSSTSYSYFHERGYLILFKKDAMHLSLTVLTVRDNTSREKHLLSDLIPTSFNHNAIALLPKLKITKHDESIQPSY